MMPALELHQGGGQVNDLHDAIDRLTGAWDALAAALGRRLEGWGDHPERVQSCLYSVQAAEREANALVARALTTGGE